MNQRKPLRYLDPVLQRRVVAAVLTGVGVTTVVSVGATAWALARLAGELPHDGGVLVERAVGVGLLAGGAAFAVSFPVLLVMMLSATMPIFGVHHRLRRHLRGVLDGTETEPLVLREGDPMQDVAALVNHLTLDRRTGGAAPVREPEAQVLEGDPR